MCGTCTNLRCKYSNNFLKHNAMEDYPKIFDCTHIDLRCENITKQELLDYIKERLDKLTDEDMLSEVAGYALVRVEQKTPRNAD